MKQHHIFTLSAIIIVIFLLIWSFFFRNGSEKMKANQEITMSYLPDSSLAVLNKNAEIKFRRKFKKRRIKANGQVYLELADNRSTYELEDDELSIKLDGSRFYIFNDKKRDTYTLITIKGTARVDVKKASGQSRITIDEGYRMEYNASSNVLQSYEIEDNNYLAWKTGQVIFKNNDVSEVISTLNDLYQVSLKVNEPNLNNCLISGTFPSDSVEAVLNGIAKDYEIEYQKTEQSYILIGQGCPLADEYGY